MSSRANYQAWCIEASEFKSFSDLVRWAVLAPSSHNTQPWKFEVEVEQGTIVVSPDLSRALKVSDPTYRQLYMSLGAACRNLKIAGRYFGLQHAQEILACPTTRTPSKRVRFSPGDSASPAEVELFHAIPRRCSQRGAHSPRPLPLELRQTLLDDAQRAGLELSLLQDRADLAQPGVMMYAVDRIILSDSGFTGELSEWVRPNFTDAPDGMPGAGFNLPDLESGLFPVMIRSGRMASLAAEADRQLFAEQTTSVRVIATDRDDPAGRAGGAARLLRRSSARDGVARTTPAALPPRLPRSASATCSAA